MEIRAKLRAAFQRLPIDIVLIGWNLPAPTLDACREEVSRAGALLYRWHPLLTGDGTFYPHPEWHTIGLTDEAVPGFRNMPEFTFVCPNRPAARETVLDHLDRVMECGAYDGLFLDRIRYPSPAADPARWLACFCDDCQRAAAEQGLDLDLVRQHIRPLLASPANMPRFLQALFGSQTPASPNFDYPKSPIPNILSTFLDFRERSVSRIVQATADRVHARGLPLGLDGLAPALTRLVGQDLGVLDTCAEWTKVMTYGHALGPAALPFELLALADWQMEKMGCSETQALDRLSRGTGLHLPSSRAHLRTHGLAPAALGAEIGRARSAGVAHLLAGIELVEITGVAQLDSEQIKADLRAFRASGADGLVLSWDLWHMPLERLDLVRSVWT